MNKKKSYTLNTWFSSFETTKDCYKTFREIVTTFLQPLKYKAACYNILIGCFKSSPSTRNIGPKSILPTVISV